MVGFSELVARDRRRLFSVRDNGLGCLGLLGCQGDPRLCAVPSPEDDPHCDVRSVFSDDPHFNVLAALTDRGSLNLAGWLNVTRLRFAYQLVGVMS